MNNSFVSVCLDALTVDRPTQNIDARAAGRITDAISEENLSEEIVLTALKNTVGEIDRWPKPQADPKRSIEPGYMAPLSPRDRIGAKVRATLTLESYDAAFSHFHQYGDLPSGCQWNRLDVATDCLSVKAMVAKVEAKVEAAITIGMHKEADVLLRSRARDRVLKLGIKPDSLDHSRECSVAAKRDCNEQAQTIHSVAFHSAVEQALVYVYLDAADVIEF
jgi:hypothetical protein